MKIKGPTPTRALRVLTRVGRFAPLLVLVISSACGGAGTGGGTGAVESSPPIRESGEPMIFGYVFMPDSVTMAEGALIFTEPFSDQVTADSLGYFEIVRNLQPGEYLIRADLNGVLGDVTTDGPLVQGDMGPLNILIGAQDRTWVPRLEAGDPNQLNTGRSTVNARGRRTCCELR